MKVSILGNGLTSFALAMSLANHGIKVDIYSDGKLKIYNKFQTLGISKSNLDFFNINILDIKTFLWNIKKIEIYREKLGNEKILNFENNNDPLFSMIKNIDLYNFLLRNLKKNKLVMFKKEINNKNLLKIGYDLIFNCEYNNFFSKKFFYKKIKKNYDSCAYITTFNHKKLLSNNVASQVFTKKGPLAFLPISPKETSVVYSVKGKTDIDFNESIKKYNMKYEIIKINKFSKFELNSSSLRCYYYKNVIAFGDMLHKLHPLAGQGFNMIIRDIKEICKLIKFKKEHGLALDSSICFNFEKNTKSRNFIFSSGIDFIYEVFNFENKINTNILSNSIKLIGKNKAVNKFLIKFADTGLEI